MSEPRQKPGRSKQDYGTPPELLEAVKRRLHIRDFGWDLAADADNAVTSSWLAKEIDALRVDPWPNCGGWNWLNPEFANIGPWVERAFNEAYDHATNTAVLIPASVGSNWWRDWVHNKCHVMFLNPRITFVGCKDPYPKDCAVLLYCLGYQGYEVWNWQRSLEVDHRPASLVARDAS